MGVGFGLAFAAMSALVVAAVPHSQTGVASGMNANIRTIGGSIGAGRDGQHPPLPVLPLPGAPVPHSQTGVASGMNANIRTIGGSIGAAVMASIVTSQLGPSGLPKEAGYTIGFAAMAGSRVLAALAGLYHRPAAQPGHSGPHVRLSRRVLPHARGIERFWLRPPPDRARSLRNRPLRSRRLPRPGLAFPRPARRRHRYPPRRTRGQSAQP